jgi:chitin disaccharide deacetylase
VSDPELLITADDYGLSEATCRAILDAHLHGVVSGTSVLAVVPRVGRHLALLDDAPDLEVGVHLALVGEDPPVLSAREVPTLVDGRGRFPRSWRHLAPRAVAGRLDPADLRRELEAQIEVVREGSGRALDHLDAHQHVHLLPAVGAEVVALAERHGIGRVRVPRSSGRGLRAQAIHRMADRLAAGLAARGLRFTDRFRGLDEAGGWTATTLARAIEELADAGGTAEVNLHPGPAVDPHRARYRWGYTWGDELAAATDPAVRRAAERAGLRGAVR